MEPAISRYCRITASTDNIGNSYMVSKMLTTKFPSLLLLMKLTEEWRKRQALLTLNCLPREQNEEADALTNSDLGLFTDRLRMKVDESTVQW